MLQMRNRGRQITKLNLTFNSEQPKDRYKLNAIYSTFSMSSVVGKKISVKLYPNDALKLQKECERSLFFLWDMQFWSSKEAECDLRSLGTDMMITD